MGRLFIDQYSLLHFATGIVLYYWGVSLKNLTIGHIIFELIENTPTGINFINKHITIWPGGKLEPDFIINRIGDILFSILGWIIAKQFNLYGDKVGWYKKHL